MDGKMRAKSMEDIAELRMMVPAKLDLRRLKYVEKVAKYERKVAECEMELAEAKGQCQEPQMAEMAV